MSLAASPSAARVLLLTGKGGVGKTTLAAATAARCAADGVNTCVVSTDTAHSLADVFDAPLGSEPVALADRLAAVHIDQRAEMRKGWESLQAYLRDLASTAGMNEVQAAELAVLPGFDDVVTLAAVVDIADHGGFDLVVVDCAPSAETIRLLSLPHVLTWWLEPILSTVPSSGTANLAMMATLLGETLGVPMPSSSLMTGGRHLLERLEHASSVLHDGERTMVRLVTTPEQVVVTETRRTATYLALFGFGIDAVIANRVLGPQVDRFWQNWSRDQGEQLERLRIDMAPAEVLEVGLAAQAPSGLDDLTGLGQDLYGDRDPSQPIRGPQRPSPHDPPGTSLRFAVEGVDSSDVRLGRQAGELHLRIGPYHRVVALPDSLVAQPVRSARVSGGELLVEFEPLTESSAVETGESA